MSDSSDLLPELKELARQVDPGEDGLERAMNLIVGELARELGVHEDEVAVFLPRQSDRETFRFAAPVSLYRDGSTFPAAGSLTREVFVTGDPIINNNVKVQKPLSIYERAKTSERHPRPIQKMLAVPIEDGDRRVGVLQLSRRGASLREAGPDFGPEQLIRLSSLASSFGPLLQDFVPSDF